jgi:putative transcriptional regulator
MKDSTDYEHMSVFEQVKTGLEQVLAHGRGELNLKTTALPLPPPPASRAMVIALRKKLKMSQSVFAAALNVSTKLVQSWEQGVRKPDRGELRLIELLIKQPDLVSGLILANKPAQSVSKVPRNGKAGSRKRATAA